MKLIWAVTTAIILCSGCKSKSTGKVEKKEVAKPGPAENPGKAETKEALLLKLSGSILLAIKNKDYQSVANHVHPVAGLRFSPYGFIDTIHDVVLKPDELIKEAGNKTQANKTWGEFDGSGEPIRMTLDKYMEAFVYDVDFAQPEIIKVNEVIGKGNSLNNLTLVYPGADFTESYFSGFDKKYEGMDWRSLRLVYKLIDGNYYLAGIIHDQWTT